MARTTDYEDIADAYDRRWEIEDFSGLERAVRELACSDPALDVLEVGCGTGHWLAMLDHAGVEAVGLDPSAGMLARAAGKIPRDRLLAGRAEQLPFAGDTFDVVYCVNVLHHVTGKRVFLSEARRVLRPGGCLMTIGLDPHAEIDRWFVYDYFEPTRAADCERYPTASTIRHWLEELGFTGARTNVAQHVAIRMPAREAIDTGHVDKRSTSQLAILSEQEYASGLARLERDCGVAESRGETLVLETDLRLYATYARMPGGQRV